MDEQVSLKIFNQILAYQFIIILSRAIGFLRDFLIIFFVGLGALSDQVFFLLSYADVLMTLFLGGGSALFVSLAMAKHSGSSDSLGSGVVFYLLLGVALMGIEIASGASFGDTLFSGLKTNTITTESVVIFVKAKSPINPNTIIIEKNRFIKGWRYNFS